MGFSVERQFINLLPVVNEDFYPVDSVIQVHDSKIGWATGLRQLIALLYAGQIPKWDLSKIRPKGSRLKTFGGRASGPKPLDELFEFTVNLFKKSAGRRLSSLDCHDLVCAIASCVVVGGVRRCLKSNTQVQMKNGSWKEISSINEGDLVKMPDGSSSQVNAVFENGEQEIVKIHLEDGTFFECSENHRWYVLDHDKNVFRWVTTKDFKTGNYSMVSPS